TLAELATLEGSLKTSMDSTKTRIEEEFAAFGQAFEDHRSRFEADFKAETSALGLSLVRLGKDIETLKTEAYENAGEKLEGFEDQLLSDLSERKAQAFGQLDAWLSDMEKTLSGIVAEAGTRRNAEEAMRPIGKEEAPRDKTPGDGDAAEI
ncbi:MAG: hypothetical protein WBH66_05230, partial [Rectinemataceae bacterium]